MAKPHIAILGAGPAGLGAAYQLTRHNLAQVTVLEQNACVGGNAGSFELDG
ncbi:MAG: FAD-dependent oxidoreductase, partial [Acidobacteria bacterium]